MDPANLKILQEGSKAFRRIRSQWLDAVDDIRDGLLVR
jgi:hypothetical protein